MLRNMRLVMSTKYHINNLYSLFLRVKSLSMRLSILILSAERNLTYFTPKMRPWRSQRPLLVFTLVVSKQYLVKVLIEASSIVRGVPKTIFEPAKIEG